MLCLALLGCFLCEHRLCPAWCLETFINILLFFYLHIICFFNIYFEFLFIYSYAEMCQALFSDNRLISEVKNCYLRAFSHISKFTQVRLSWWSCKFVAFSSWFGFFSHREKSKRWPKHCFGSYFSTIDFDTSRTTSFWGSCFGQHLSMITRSHQIKQTAPKEKKNLNFI